MTDKKPTSIFLIGMMASGKSTVGRRLAERLGWAFYDADREIETRCGVPISYIFEKEQNESFCYRLDEPKSPNLRNDRPVSVPYKKHLVGGFPKISREET